MGVREYSRFEGGKFLRRDGNKNYAEIAEKRAGPLESGRYGWIWYATARETTLFD
jgi:hypothetical protein